MPAGNSMKILEMNHAETTRPTKRPEGSRSAASNGRNEPERLIPIMMENPMNMSSKKKRG
jgi:hypothetical protein